MRRLLSANTSPWTLYLHTVGELAKRHPARIPDHTLRVWSTVVAANTPAPAVPSSRALIRTERKTERKTAHLSPRRQLPYSPGMRRSRWEEEK